VVGHLSGDGQSAPMGGPQLLLSATGQDRMNGKLPAHADKRQEAEARNVLWSRLVDRFSAADFWASSQVGGWLSLRQVILRRGHDGWDPFKRKQGAHILLIS
jgi:hypothetical protein